MLELSSNLKGRFLKINSNWCVFSGACGLWGETSGLSPTNLGTFPPQRKEVSIAFNADARIASTVPQKQVQVTGGRGDRAVGRASAVGGYDGFGAVLEMPVVSGVRGVNIDRT